MSCDRNITAVIPCRGGSTRCPAKNTRSFLDVNLLKRKIQDLRSIDWISEIIVSSDCDIARGIAEAENVRFEARPPEFATSTCSGRDVYRHLASLVKTEYIMYTHCVTPFSDARAARSVRAVFEAPDFKGSIVTVSTMKHFAFLNNTALNFDPYCIERTQGLSPVQFPNFGICISRTEDLAASGSLFTEPMHTVPVPEPQGIDIDDPIQFIEAELLARDDVISPEIASRIIRGRDVPPQTVDCTIRDGGYANNWDFSDSEVKSAAMACMSDYFEIGFRHPPSECSDDRRGKWYYSSDSDISEIIDSVSPLFDKRVAVMARAEYVTCDEFLDKCNSRISMVRVLLPRDISHESIGRTVNLCSGLLGKGYAVALNISNAIALTDAQIERVIDAVAGLDLCAIYLADTHGDISELELPGLVHRVQRLTDKPLGFHAHNNMQNAMAKVKIAKFHGVAYIDSSIGGAGRGAGNAASEVLFGEHMTRDMFIHVSTFTRTDPGDVLASVHHIHPDFISALNSEYPDSPGHIFDAIHYLIGKFKGALDLFDRSKLPVHYV